jgi:hypothetical protein
VAIHVDFKDPVDAARVVDALLAQADLVDSSERYLATRYRRIADDIGDALHRLPKPVSCPIEQDYRDRLRSA